MLSFSVLNCWTFTSFRAIILDGLLFSFMCLVQSMQVFVFAKINTYINVKYLGSSICPITVIVTCLYLYMPIFSHISVYYILLTKSINILLEINDFKILRLVFESAHWKCLLKLNNLPEEFVASY